MKIKHGLRAAGILAVASLSWHSTVSARIANPELIPADATVVISVPDASELSKAASGNSLFSAINTQVTPFVKERIEEAGAADKIKSVEKVLGFDLTPENVLGIFSSMDIYVLQGESVDEVQVGGVFAVQDSTKANQLLSLLSLSVGEAIGGGEPKKQTYKEMEITSLGEDDALSYAKTDKLLLAASSVDELKKLIDRSAEKPSANFASSDDFKKVSGEIGNGQVYFYMDGAKLQQLTGGNDLSNPLAGLTASMQTTKLSGGLLRFEPKSIVSLSASTLASGPLSDFIRKNPGKDIGITNFVSPDALLYFGTSVLDSKAIGEGIQAIAGAVPGSDEMLSQVKEAETALGFSFANDLVPALGNELGIVVLDVDPNANPFPKVDLGLVVKVADEAKMNKVIDGIEKAAAPMLAVFSGGDPSSAKFGSKKLSGATVRTVPVPVPSVSPGIAIHNGYMVIGSTDAAVTSLLEGKSGAKGLLGSSEFKNLGPLVTNNGQAVNFLNLGRIGNLAVNVLKQRATGDSEAEAMTKRVEAVVKTLGAIGNSQTVKNDLLISNAVLSLN
jgi:hypothetical protein